MYSHISEIGNTPTWQTNKNTNIWQIQVLGKYKYFVKHIYHRLEKHTLSENKYKYLPITSTHILWQTQVSQIGNTPYKQKNTNINIWEIQVLYKYKYFGKQMYHGLETPPLGKQIPV